MRRATPYLLLLTLGCGGGDDGGDDDDDDGVGSTDSGFLACGDQNCGDDELCVEVASGVNIYSQVCEPAPSCVPPRDERFGSDFCSSFDDCRDELAALTNVQADLAEKLDELTRAEGALLAERQTLNGLLAEKARKAKQTEAARALADKRVAKLVREAKTLRELMHRLNRPAAKPAPEAPEHAKVNEAESQLAARPTGRPSGLRDFPDRPEAGAFAAPAAGRVIRRYGQDLGYGQSAKGVTIRTRDDAQVVAPFDGKIAFAGSFRDHGLILIIQHSGGYHTVLAGFARVDVVEGQWLLAGEPVGIMSAAVSGAKPELYVELRRGGQPINPLRWIKTGSIKVHG